MSGASCCDCGLVDAHTHWVPRAFPQYLGQRKGVSWPSMAPVDSSCDRNVMIDGKVYRTVPETSWSGPRRTEEMTRMKVSHQVVSPMPELLSYWLHLEDALALTRFMNEDLSAMCTSDARHFTGLGAVPLQDVGVAIEELERCLSLGLAGVELGSNINGKPLGHPDHEPFFAAAVAMGAAIFVHAVRPAGMDRLVGPPSLEQAVAFPGEVGLSAVSMMTSGILARHPDLRIAFSHGGGSLAMNVARLQHAWEHMPAIRSLMERSPRELAQQLYVDDLVYDGDTIHHLMQLFGKTRLMAGTDYPFAIMDRDPHRRVADLALDDEAERLLRCDNAMRWLGRTDSNTEGDKT